MKRNNNPKAGKPLTQQEKEAKMREQKLLRAIFGPYSIEDVEERKKRASAADLQCTIHFSELMRMQRKELKQRMLQERLTAMGLYSGPDELWRAFEFISDDELAERYRDELFCKADFSEIASYEEDDEDEPLDSNSSQNPSDGGDSGQDPSDSVGNFGQDSSDSVGASGEDRDRRVTELTPDELLELKQSLLDERNEALGEGTSWGELANADDLISDEEVFERYRDTTFCSDDFFCNSRDDDKDD